jgi:hypothetical protein
MLDKEISALKKLHNCETGTQHPSISEKDSGKNQYSEIPNGRRKNSDQKYFTSKADEKHIGAFLNHGEIKRSKETNH